MTKFLFWRCGSESLSHWACPHWLQSVLGQEAISCQEEWSAATPPVVLERHVVLSSALFHILCMIISLVYIEVFVDFIFSKKFFGGGAASFRHNSENIFWNQLRGRSSVKWMIGRVHPSLALTGLWHRGKTVCVHMWQGVGEYDLGSAPLWDAKQAWLRADKHC